MIRTAIKRRRCVKPVNAKRKAAEFKRCYHSKERVEWVKEHPCLVGGFCCTSPFGIGVNENAHIPSRSGMSRKGPYTKIVPLCKWHHTASPDASLHALNKEGFNRYHGLDLDAEAAALEARWQAYLQRTTP